MNEPQIDRVSFRGGIDLTSAYLELRKGFALLLQGYEARLGGGYERLEGCERVDGQSAPSDAVYYTVGVADSSGISVGATLTGATSGATSEVVIKDDDTNTLGVTALSGNYTLSETANGTTISAVESLSGQSDPTTSAIWQLAAEDYYRDLITAVTGSGNTLGCVQYKNTKYAFRYDGSSGVDMYKSSASGWTQVSFYHYIFFDGGTLADGDVAAGTTITGATSSATATVKKFVKNAGTYGVNASGYMVIDVTSGTFQDNENIQVSAVTKCVADGANVAISLSNGGKFRFDQYNFYGSADTKYLYGCDGVNFAWEFDGTTLCPIFYPAPTKHPSWNTPKYIRAHKSHLFLLYAEGTAGTSSIGTPLVISGLLGASQFGLGDEPTGLAERAGDVLAVYTKDKTFGLYGTSSADWNLQIISDTAGAIDDSVQEVGTFYGLDTKGIIPIDRVDSYGDFESATVSRLAKDFIDARAATSSLASVVVGAHAVRNKNQYRLLFNDGYMLIMTVDAYLGDGLPQFTTAKIPFTPTCMSNYEDSSGNEVILVGDSDGYVYQFEKSYNWDGDSIESAFRTTFLHQGSPEYRKRYKRAYLDIKSAYNVTLNISYQLSSGDYYVPNSNDQDLDFYGGGGYWGVSNWAEFNWDSAYYPSKKIPLSGRGTNISFLVYDNSATTKPFTIQSLRIHYLPRRLERA